MYLLHLALLIAIASSCDAVAIDASSTPVAARVNTTSGEVVGQANAAYPLVSEYLSIPFGEPPVGPLRFGAPQAFQPKAAATIINATVMPPSCIQAPSNVNYSQPQNWQDLAISDAVFRNHTSEDCLYLNVWTRFSFQAVPLKPVLIWLYGGGFHSGGASDPSTNGAFWAHEQDVLIVSFNYRLGIFGFSGAPNMTQNVALLDQRLAVEWVRDNIAQFGGDPSRITMFGHSAGGASVSLYSYAWRHDPIVEGFIPMSGTSDNFGNRYPSTSLKAWEETATVLGCGNASATSEATVLSCMRSKPVSTLFRASVNASDIFAKSLTTGQLLAGITGVFGPTIDNITVFENYTLMGDAGNFTRKPLLTGSNIDEGCFFVEEGRVPASDASTLTEEIFTCPVDTEALAFASAGVPAWKYRFYPGFPNLAAPACPGKPWHGAEQFLIFGNTANVTGEADTAGEKALALYMRTAWTAFARDPAKGLLGLQWPRFNGTDHPDYVVALGLNGTLHTVESGLEIDKNCETLFRGGIPNY